MAVDEIFKEAFNGFVDELVNKKRFTHEWEGFCRWGGVSGGKGQPEFPAQTVGSFTTLLAVASWRPANHRKTIMKNKGLFTRVAITWRNK